MPPIQSVIEQAARLHNAGQLKEAVDLYQVVLRADPRNWQVHYNMGNALRGLGRLNECLTAYLATAKLRPDLVEAHNDLGVALAQTGRWREALGALRRALVLSPSLTGAHKAYGVALKEQGFAAEAIRCFDHALVCQPGQADALFARGESLLQIGDWKAGWRDYRHRFGVKYLNFRPRPYAQPMWNGEPGEGRTLLLWAEQGYGDTLQFCRFAPILARLGWRVVLEVPADLKRLVSTLPDITVVSMDETPPPFDRHFPLLDVAGALGVTPERVPSDPYLSPAPALANAWRDRLYGLTGPKVGIVWRGRTTNVRERWRGTSAELFSRFIRQKGLSFVSLQKDARPEELAELRTGVMNAGPDLTDFADTAALIANLDLVITTDTAVCHLAGSLGIPTWILLDAGADWRWMSGRSDSPWYASTRLFRQPKPGDWTAVVQEVKRALGEIAPAA